MAGGRFEVALEPATTPSSHGVETSRSASRRIRSSRWVRSRALRRAASCRASRSRFTWPRATSATCRRSCSTKWMPASAARSRRRSAACCKRSATRRQVLCVTHLPQVAAHADQHFRVVKTGDREQVSSELARLSPNRARRRAGAHAGGQRSHAKTRAHAKELYEQHAQAAKRRLIVSTRRDLLRVRRRLRRIAARICRASDGRLASSVFVLTACACRADGDRKRLAGFEPVLDALRIARSACTCRANRAARSRIGLLAMLTSITTHLPASRM